jgi:hypothetical protein
MTHDTTRRAQSEVILKATKKAMPDHAKVLLVEYTVPLGPQPSMAKALDLRTSGFVSSWCVSRVSCAVACVACVVSCCSLILPGTDMMTLLGAKERTKAEFTALFRGAGLELTQVAGTEGQINVIEARLPQQ